MSNDKIWQEYIEKNFDKFISSLKSDDFISGKKEIINEIIGIVNLSHKFRVALEDKLRWGQELRELLHSPDNNKELLNTHFKNGTEQR